MGTRSLTLVTALAVVVALHGCVRKVDDGASTASGEPVKLVLFTWTEVTELAANQELMRRFEAAHPNLKVEIQNVPGSEQAMQKLQTMMAGGTAPDVMSLHGAFYLPFASKGVLYDLESFIREDRSFDLKAFYPGLVEISRWEGKLYSLPRYTSVYTLFYNHAKFDAAGVPYPGSDGAWTWDKYLQAARKLTRDTNGDGKADEWGTYIDFWGSRLYPWLWQSGADLMSQDLSRCVIDSPKAIEALTFVRDLRHRYGVSPPSTAAERNEGLDLFIQEKIAMYMTGPWDVQTLLEKPALQWDVYHLPQRERRATLLGTENYAISAQTKHPQEAWELFKFLMSAESQEFMATELNKMPALAAVAEKAFTDVGAPYHRHIFVEALGYAQRAPNIPEWGEVQNYLQDQMDLIWIGEKTPAQGARDAARDFNQALAKLRSKPSG